MLILVFNCGSSSIKSAVIDSKTGSRQRDIRIEGIGEADTTLSIDGISTTLPLCPDYDSALKLIAQQMQPVFPLLSGVGHRVVHGGEKFTRPTRINDEVETAIEALESLAPLHNPACLAGIKEAGRLLPDIPHVAVFDTAFHSTLPSRAKAYALPPEVTQKSGIRRYGFHGISHEFVANRAAVFLGEDLRTLRIITCHLGNGCSMTAVEYGRSIETSMGMTPLEGLVMGSRSGDVDPGVLIHLLREGNMSAEGLDQLLNRKSGLLGMTGVNDMRIIEERAGSGDEACRLAIHVYTHRIRKYIGAYAAVMGGVDAIVFAGGIGENSALIRHRVAQRLDFLGAQFDEELNRDAKVSKESPVAEISSLHSRTRLLIVATDEERLIAERASQLVEGGISLDSNRRVPIAVSARHIHLTNEAIDSLFGKGHQLSISHPLSQPGQYAAEELVTLVGPKRTIENVRVLGPPRSYNQVEISRSDEFYLGVDAPVRASGDIENSPGITLVGTSGTVHLRKGVICAWRHIHMQAADADRWGVADGDVVDVAVDSDGRDLEFRDVLIRVSPDFKLEMHLDTDEANAAGLNAGDEGVLMRIPNRAILRLKTPLSSSN